MTTVVHTPDSLKSLRETLCLAQSALAQWPAQRLDRVGDRLTILSRLIEDIDRQRPLGPDGKHGDRHTITCGCHPGDKQRANVVVPHGPHAGAW